MKLWKKTILVALIAVVLEVGYFNFSHWRMQLNADIEKNVTLSLQEGYPLNWEEKDGVLYSLEDPQILFETSAMEIQNIEIYLDGAKGVDTCLFYYTDADGVVQVVSGVQIEQDRYRFTVKDTSSGVIRFDTESAGQMQLRDLEIIINPDGWDISISRIVAVILIYLVGVLLFQTQKMPDYEAYIRGQKGGEEQ